MYSNAQIINSLLKKHQNDFGKTVDFDKGSEHLIELDFTQKNRSLTTEIINDIHLFSDYIDSLLVGNNAKFGIGGYMENRTVYARSEHFGKTGQEEPRRLHLGVDIWGAVNSPIYAFMDAKIHSFSFNNNFGDYGATIILEHQIEGSVFYSLYGHLSLDNLNYIAKNDEIKKGTQFCDFGNALDNGNWPAHLHFQLICDMEGREGDYPGVGKLSEKEQWLSKIPDPNIILGF
ncbi:peptidoglycan DD-metalloendopeptidase family protein [Pedobacter sp. SD-b]|uniref:Peptidoglycan DD-metalloendopeptidase family protein n=1 Tax=Pedobacter segetis TaxID=2793069 RepID=A0ABS1BEV6_9SPHI|nr:peptidoglycan DD-metalloendopeptidase family protein [Pedobacter segetis]MBK0381402.1 peptidoglycan DD-metalloendopeptidase family protein [Pedobacter segetis]